LILIVVLLTSIINNASGQSNEKIDTILVLHEIPSKIVIGERMYFSGHIETVEDEGLADMPIEIWATHDRGAFVLLETISDDEGNFRVEWIIENIGTSVEIDATFSGNKNYKGSSSNIQTVDLRRPGFIETEIELNPIMHVMISGKSAIFSGYLKTDDGKAIPNVKIIIEGLDPEYDSFELANAVTDSNGFFQTEGNVQTQVSNPFEVYAHFEGEKEFESSYSDFYVVKFISELNGIATYKEEYYLKETITIIGVFREQSSDLESQLVKVEIIDPSGTLYDSHSVTLETDRTFSDELTINDGLTGKYLAKAYLNDVLVTSEFLLLNKADVNPNSISGPFCASEYIYREEGTIVGDIPTIGTTFTLNHEDETFDIVVFTCGHYLESLAFNQHDRYIDIKDFEGIKYGEVVEVLVPSRLLDGDFTIFGDEDIELEFELSTSEDINVIRIERPYSGTTITIQGTTVIPEFTVATIILAVTMSITILFVTKIRGNFLSKNFKRLESE